MFSALDIGIVVFFMVVTVIAGVWTTKRASKSLESYFLGDRGMPWYLLGIAGMCNWFDLTGTMMVASFLFMVGPRGLFIEFRGGAVLVLALMLLWTGKWHRRSGCMTMPEWMIFRFGNTNAAKLIRFITALVMIISTVGMLAYTLRGTTIFLSMLDIPISPNLGAALLIGICAIYTMLAGFYGMIVTDLIQGVKIIVIGTIVGILAYMKVGDVDSLGAIANAITGNTQWTQSYPAFYTHMPKGYELYQSLFMFAMLYLIRNIVGGLGTGGEARYFGAKSDKDCGLQSMLQGIVIAFRWPLMIGIAVLGIYLVNDLVPNQNAVAAVVTAIKVQFPNITQAGWHELTHGFMANHAKIPAALLNIFQTSLGADWAKILPFLSFNGTIDPEAVFCGVLLYSIPTGIKGLLMAALLAAMMSCVTGLIQSAAAPMVRDIYQAFIRPHARHWELIMASWVSTLLLIVAGFYMGLFAKNINDIWAWLVMGLGGGTIASFLRLYWWRCTATGMIAGQLLGGVGAVVQRIFYPEMPENYQFLLLSAISIISTVAISYLSEVPHWSTLEQFYRKTKPFGFWGPLKSCIGTEERVAMELEHKNDLLALPFTLLAQVTLFLTPMLLIIHNYVACFGSLVLFFIGAVGMYVFWWKKLK